jgi:CO/xanthine dehydrogenase FAD-binding subunit
MYASYHAPQQLDAALSLLSAGGHRIIAGGTDLFPALPAGGSDAALVDLTRIPELRGVTRTDGAWVFGAATTWSDVLKADLPPCFDGLKQAAREVGSLQIQNAGTIGGNLCNASPAADGVPPLLSLDAVITLASAARGTRHLPLADFMLGVRKTALAADELLIAITVPEQPVAARSAFLKLGTRRYLVISIAMVAVVLDCDASGQIVSARVAVGACAPVAKRLPLLEAALVGQRPRDAVVLAEHLAPLSPIDDVRGSGEYRKEAVAELCARAIHLAGAGHV